MNSKNSRYDVFVLYDIQECIPTLAAFISLHTDTAVRIAALQALTNLSVTPTYHSQLLPFADSFVDVATNSTDVKLTLQSLRLLANMTLSRPFVDHMLQDKVSDCFKLALF